jgi:hypothetical protein
MHSEMAESRIIGGVAEEEEEWQQKSRVHTVEFKVQNERRAASQ